MSRGLGKVQRGILECLECYGDCDFSLLYEHILGVGHSETPVEIASVSRAVASLVKQGLVEKWDMDDGETAEWDGGEEYVKTGMGFRRKKVGLVKR